MTRVERRVAILQSSYVPWRGYFDMIRRVDHFLLYDEVQYTRRSWRNRNRIRTAHGVHWLTVPVRVKGQFEQRIDQTRIDGTAWAHKHWRTLRHAYGRAPYWERYAERLEALYLDDPPSHLSVLNRRFLRALCELLAIDTPIEMSTDYRSEPGRNRRLIRLCRELDADVYVSGPSARVYVDEDQFAAAGLRVEWLDYPEYAPYLQVHGGWEPRLSVLDLLFNVGPESASWVARPAQECAAS